VLYLSIKHWLWARAFCYLCSVFVSADSDFVGATCVAFGANGKLKLIESIHKKVVCLPMFRHMLPARAHVAGQHARYSNFMKRTEYICINVTSNMSICRVSRGSHIHIHIHIHMCCNKLVFVFVAGQKPKPAWVWLISVYFHFHLAMFGHMLPAKRTTADWF